MPTYRTVCVLLAVSLFVALSCQNEAATGPPPPPPSFRVTISTGLNPTYSWPGGKAFSLRVTPMSNPTKVVWSVVTLDANNQAVDNIVSPVVHGTVPPGAQVVGDGGPLTSGTFYEVTVARANGEAGVGDFFARP